MAQAFLQLLLSNLSSLIQGEIGLILGVDQEMNKLSSTLTTIQAVVEDAEQKQFESKPIQDWLCKLNDLTYEIDDILDECAMEVSKSEHKNSLTSRYGLKKILFRHKMGRRIKEVAGKLDMIASVREKFHLRELGTERRSNYAATRETGSVFNETQVVYGRDEEKKKIVDILVNQVKDCEQLSVLPIKGIGGLGKTTLARMVFNDKEVIGHFEIKIWVCVSDNFDLKTVIKAMIESATGSASDSDLTSLDALQCRLRGLLNQKRYLLVLDDVWDDIVGEKWEMLRNVITCGSRGAAVVLTTRLTKVAEIMRTLPTHSIGELSEENCWLLFKERAFGQEKEEYPNLESIGKQIVKKCGGVPLAAKALGGLLRFKRTEKEWLHVKDSEIWNLPPEETSLLPALRLSYHHLPLELRRCFAYCAVFPKDSEIGKETLIFHWMAHGYISSNVNREEEDIGNDIWNELVLRSLFQDEETNYKGKTFTTMHDLVHDLAQLVMENKVPGIQMQCKSKGKIRQVNLRKHHVAFPSDIQLEIDLSFSLMNLSSLRILDASRTSIDNIPSTISNLKHLRYLNLSSTEIRILPGAICSLWNLKILNMNDCGNLVELPKDMRLLKNLRHLLLEKCGSLSETPSKIGELSSLKTLSLFVVGHGKGRKLGELQFLNLGGKLSIHHLERVENHIEAKMANLAEKEDLRELRLKWNGESKKSKLLENMEEKVLETLKPHPNLQILEIIGFNGRDFAQWLRNSSSVNLVECRLESCPNCSSLPQLGELPHLKILCLSHLVVEYIVEDEVEDGSPIMTKFPSLQKLELRFLCYLKGFRKKEGMKIFPRLQELCIQECSPLILPPLPALKELDISKCSNLILSSRLDDVTSLTVRDGDISNELLENLANLKTLTIHKAHETSLPAQGLRGLKSLECLGIARSKLTCLPHAWSLHLATLKDLMIFGCREFVELPEDIKHLRSLTKLHFYSLDKMVSLPEALKHLPSLCNLGLTYLPQLTALPEYLASFTSLRHLWIDHCPKLTSLPHSIKDMGNLEILSIWGCPELERRCEKERGEDWHKIAHIPGLSIGLILPVAADL